ncbi:MAG: type II toxin-antitoxin system VapC family toxin [Chloroflexota bacterium]
MSRHLLDTDVLIDYSKGREPAVARIREMLDQGDDLGVCAVNVAEFFAGVPPDDRAYWRTVFSTLTYWPISRAAAERAGMWRKEYSLRGQTLSTADALTAAVAVEHGAALVTRNAKDYPMPELRLTVLGSEGR